MFATHFEYIINVNNLQMKFNERFQENLLCNFKWLGTNSLKTKTITVIENSTYEANAEL